MGNKTHKDMGFKIDKTSTLVAITDYLNSQSLQSAISMLDQAGLDDSVHSYLNGAADPKLSLNGYWNTTTEAIFGPCIDGTAQTKTFEFQSYSGRYYNGECLPSNVQVSGKFNELQLFSVDLSVSGTFNRTSAALA